MRLRGRVDRNQQEIADSLRRAGCSVCVTSNLGVGVADLLAGYRGKNFLFEIKDGTLSPSRRKLTEKERQWHDGWKGQVSVIYSVEDALRIIELG
jgi:hypothetical protein